MKNGVEIKAEPQQVGPVLRRVAGDGDVSGLDRTDLCSEGGSEELSGDVPVERERRRSRGGGGGSPKANQSAGQLAAL